jgi:hypothetical protein
MSWLFSEIKDGQDLTIHCIKALAAVALIGGLILILAILINIWLPARAAERAIAVHDAQTFKKLQAKHGQEATRIVVYEADGEAYFYKDGKKIKFQ